MSHLPHVRFMRAPAPFEDTASTCGADTCTVTAVDSGKGGNYSKANEAQTESQRIMLRLRHAKQRAPAILQKALNRYSRNTSDDSIDDFEKLFREHKAFLPARSDLYMKCRTLIDKKLPTTPAPKASAQPTGAAEDVVRTDTDGAEVSDTVNCHCTSLLDLERKHLR